jgi:nucleotide-binding universal stress UspA family protein
MASEHPAGAATPEGAASATGAGPLQPGQRVDHWQLVRLLHRGGMADLWEIEAPGEEADQPLIMKVPRLRGGEDPAAIVGFEVEQMILPALRGPHVPRFVARGDFSRQPYIVMERLPGESLEPRIDASPLAVQEVADIGERVALALHALHRQRLVHLDVKPGNVMFRPDGQAVLIDFGLSRHDSLPDLLDEELPLPLGTGPYISPEQVRRVRHDPRSDLFALGAMLYHLTTGHRAFGAPESLRGLQRRLYEQPVPPRQWRQDCPPWLQEVILCCLEVDPDRRWQSGAQLAMALRDPAQLPLTERAARLHAAGRWPTFRRWLKQGAGAAATPASGALARKRAQTYGGAAQRIARSPIVLAALDIDHAGSALLESVRETVRRVLVTEPGARLACLSVMKTQGISMDRLVDDQGRSIHVQQLVALQAWARPIGQSFAFDEGRLTFHVLEAPDAASAIIDFARRTQVDHIVMGARAASALRQYLGSVSSQVVAQAPCTVTVVRT